MSLTLHGRVQDTTKTIAQGMNVENKSAVRAQSWISNRLSRGSSFGACVLVL